MQPWDLAIQPVKHLFENEVIGAGSVPYLMASARRSLSECRIILGATGTPFSTSPMRRITKPKFQAALAAI